VTDARGGPEEALGGDTGELSDAVLDETVVARGLAIQRQLGLRALAREALGQGAGLALDLEVEGDLGRGRGAPGVGPADILSIGIGLAVEDQLEGLLDARLAGLVRSTDDGQASGRFDLQLVVALEVRQADTSDTHG